MTGNVEKTVRRRRRRKKGSCILFVQDVEVWGRGLLGIVVFGSLEHFRREVSQLAIQSSDTGRLSATGTSESISIRHANLIQTSSLRLSFSPAWQTSSFYVILISMGFSAHFQFDSCRWEETSWKQALSLHPPPPFGALTFWRFNRNKSSLTLHLFPALSPTRSTTLS